MRSPVIALSLAVAVLATPGAAAAAPRAISPVKLFESSRVDGIKVAVSPKDEAISVIDNESDSSLELLARVRSATGTVGPAQELSRTPNAELPSSISFGATGNAFMQWGIATNGALGEWTFRPPGALFSVTRNFEIVGGLPCGRFAESATDTSGKLLIACSTVSGSNSGVAVTSSTNGGESFSGLSGVQPAIADPNLQPEVATGPGGVRAVVWLAHPTGGSSTLKAIVDTGSGTFGATEILATAPAGSEVELNDVAVLDDGTVAVLYNDESVGGIRMRLRRPGDGSFRPSQTIDADRGGVSIVPDSPAGSALLLVAHIDIGPIVQWRRITLAPDGTLSAPTIISTGNNSTMFDLKRGADGTIAVGRTFLPSPGAAREIDVFVKRRGGSMSGPIKVASVPPTSDIASRSLDVDRKGNVFLGWVEDNPLTDRALIGGLDLGAKPSVSGVVVASRVARGGRASFSLNAADTSGIASVKWSFGDRRTASGPSTSHVYRRTGRFKVTAKVTDRAGFVTTVTRRVRVVG